MKISNIVSVEREGAPKYNIRMNNVNKQLKTKQNTTER